MFVSSGQLYVFLASFSFGYIFGVVYYAFCFFKAFTKSKIIKTIFDIVFFSLFSVCYLFYSDQKAFPFFRIFAPFSALFGLFCFYKSFEKYLAKFTQKAYNYFVKIKGKIFNGRSKKKKACVRRHGNRCVATRDFAGDTYISVVRNKRRKQKKSGT